MDTDKAYLLGLIIGGGVFGNDEDVFQIKLPYKKWGSYEANPERAGKISKDIMNKVNNMFRAIYNISVQFETSGGTWTILCEGDISDIKSDLKYYGIDCEGVILLNTRLDKIVPDLVDDTSRRRFIAGLLDTIGSMAKSHRRFTDEHQIVSFEIKGYNYKFVCDLCKLLYSINCIPDQVNWNHPNIHCPSNAYYKQWNKGFKLRVLLDQYSQFGAFTFGSKAEAAIENRKLQQQTHSAQKCEEREIHITPSCVHNAESDIRLPENIRGGHYVNFKHICAVMGCEHAPFKEIESRLCEAEKYINPFPILCKDERMSIEKIINDDELLKNRNYNTSKVLVKSLADIYKGNRNALVYGKVEQTGYPIAIVLQAIAFVLVDKEQLSGTRVSGGYETAINAILSRNPKVTVEIRVPDLLTPLVIVSDSRAALVGANNPDVYKQLISYDPNNKYKIYVRKITEEDLKE